MGREGDGDGPGFARKLHGLVVDYEGTLGKADRPLHTYPALAQFDEVDLEGILTRRQSADPLPTPQ